MLGREFHQISASTHPLVGTLVQGPTCPTVHRHSAEMELVCGYMDPKDHVDVGLGPPFCDSECWRTSKENGRDAGERLKRDTWRVREMGQWARKECERYLDGYFFLAPSLGLWCAQLYFISTGFVRNHSHKIHPHLCKSAWPGFCSCNQIISKTHH